MTNEVVLDIETSNTFQDVGGFFPKKLDVSVVVAYYYEFDEYRQYLMEDLPKLFQDLEQAGTVITYNGIGFDMPMLNRYYAGDLLLLPQCDMLAHIRESLGFRIKLDDVASATIGTKKSAHGLLAVKWWKEGKVQEVLDYCQQDVKVTKEVYEFGLENGYILFDDRTGERRQVNIDFKDKQEEKGSTINLTMGF